MADMDMLETSTTASWTDVQIPPAPDADVPPLGRQYVVLDVEAAAMEAIPLNILFSVLQAKLSRTRVDGPPSASEVLSENTWDEQFPHRRVHVEPEDGYRLHVRTDSLGGRVPAGLMRFRDAAAAMSSPSTIVGPCVVRGVGAGKIMLSRLMDDVIPGPEVRHSYLVNVYLSYEAPLKRPRVGDGGPLRDLVFVPRPEEEEFMSLFVSLSRLGHGPTVMPVVGCVQSWSMGRMEVLVRTQQNGLFRGPNGLVHAARVGAASCHNVQANRLHPLSAASVVSVLGDLQVAMVLSAEQLRSSMVIYKAVLSYAVDHDLSALQEVLVQYKAKVTEHDDMADVHSERHVRDEADAVLYVNNVLALITSSIHKMGAWRNVPREVVGDHHVFFRILSILSPLITATVDFGEYIVVEDVMSVTAGVLMPFTSINGHGEHVQGPWGKTKEDVLVEWVLSILKRVYDVLVDIMGASRVQSTNAVKSTIDVFVPSFEPTMQALFLALMSERPGYDGSLSHEISDSTEHLFLSKQEISGWPNEVVQEYQIPFHALSSENDALGLSDLPRVVHSDIVRLHIEVGVHKNFGLVEKMSQVPSFKDKMANIVTTEVVDVLFEHCRDASTVTDNHLELVPLPVSFWGADFLSMTTDQRAVVKYLFYKRLSDVVSEWRNADRSGRWQMSFIRYK